MPTPDPPLRRHRPSHRRMDRPTTPRRLPLGHRATLSSTGSTRNRTQREGTHNGVHGASRQGDAFSWKTQELDIELDSASMPFGSLNHCRTWFKCIDLGHSSRIVVEEIHASANADLENLSFGQGDGFLPNLLDGLWVS